MLFLLFIPNILWSRHKPADYDVYAARENPFLLWLERIGQATVTVLAVSFSDFNPSSPRLWDLWLWAAGVSMLLYELYWVRYFRSPQTMEVFYSSFLGIPLAGATLPVLAFLLLAVYGRNLFLFAAVVILGIGHIGIHAQHKKEIKGPLP